MTWSVLPGERARAAALVVALIGVGVVMSAAPAQAATFTVDSTADAIDASPGNATCATSGGACTLRAAIQEANALPGADTITVPAGTYTLSIANTNPDGIEDNSATGDLDIRSAVTINGAGAGSTTVNGGPTRTHALLAGSPAIDAANPVCPPPATDQRGVERVQDGDGNGTARCDIGSFERGPFLSIDDVTVKEGKSGTTDATFTVTISPPSGQKVTVTYSTANGKAKAPGDYEARNGTLVFEPGQTTKSVAVPIKGDRKFERTEHFFLNLSGATNATIADGQGKGTIRNDDKKRRR